MEKPFAKGMDRLDLQAARRLYRPRKEPSRQVNSSLSGIGAPVATISC